MKRGAEKQLSKDTGSDDEQDGVEPGQGFVKAEESVLAARKIRGLPKRLAGGGAAPTPTGPAAPAAKVESAPAPKFAGFAGFGASTSSSTPFSFASAAKPAEPQPNATTNNSFASFGSKPTFTAPVPSPSAATSAFTPSAPAVASNASAATKMFASFLSSPPSKASSEPKVNKEESISETNNDQFEAEKQYYTALRGLNVSFLTAVSKAIESDPFLDVAEVLEKYKNLRLSVKTDFDKNKKAKAETKPAAPTPATQAFSFGKPASTSTTDSTQPTPTSGGFTFGKPSESSSSAPTNGGLASKMDSSSNSTKLPFSLTKSSTPSENSDTTAKLPFALEPPSSTSDSSSSTSKSPFSFGNSTSNNSGKSPFSFGDNSSGSSKAFGSNGSTPSIFSSNMFSKTSDNSKSEEEESKKKDVPSFSSTSNNPFASKSSSSTPFTFGSSSPGKPSAFSGFGKSPGAGSIGNPVGFGFGSPPRTPSEVESGAPPTPSAASATTFGGFFGSVPKPETTAAPSDAESGAGATAATTEGEAPPLMTVGNPQHDTVGEGEEDEDTIFEVRSKVFKLVKKQDGSSEWTDMGIGVLRLKKHKESGVRRVLLRNSSTGKITINFNVYDGMTPAATDKVVSFMGHDKGVSVPYKLRIKTNQMANDLKAALDREIEFVKAKSDI